MRDSVTSFYKNSSFFLYPEHAFFILVLAAVKTSLLTLRAFFGQTATQAIQVMQASLSVLAVPSI